MKEYKVAGDYVLSKINLTNFDGSETVNIYGIVNSISINESIFTPCITGTINVSDSVGLSLELPIIGQETVEFTYTTTTENPAYPPVVRSFRIWSLTNKRASGYTGCEYVLHFVSPEFIANETTKISEAYNNMSISSIVTSVFSKLNSKKRLFVDPTVNNQRLTVPYMTPIDVIMWLATFARHSQTDGTSFFFYEDQFGFKFKTLQDLYTQTPVDSYGRAAKLLSVTSDSQQAAIDKGFNSQTQTQLFDTIGMLRTGFLGSNLFTLDLTTRAYEHTLYDYRKAFDKQRHLSPGTIDTAGLFTKTADMFSTDACHKFLISPTQQIKSSYIKSKKQDTVIFSKKREEVLQERLGELNEINQIQVVVEIPGDSRIYAGCIVTLNMPSYGITDNKVSPVDPYYSGNYLVSEVDHVFSGNVHTTIMHCMKDSVQKTRVNQKTAADGSPITN